MATGRTTTVIILALLAALASTSAAATEIYHWLDENGIPNFSQEHPDGNIPDVSILYLADTTPSDYDPEEDRYGVQAQAERMNALREEMEQRRNAIRERQRITAQQQLVQYREPVPRYSLGYWFPPIHARPPHKPQPPIVMPTPTSTLEPSGRSLN